MPCPSGSGCVVKNAFFTGTRSRAGGKNSDIIPHEPNVFWQTDQSIGGVDSRHFSAVRRGLNPSRGYRREYQQEKANLPSSKMKIGKFPDCKITTCITFPTPGIRLFNKPTNPASKDTIQLLQEQKPSYTRCLGVGMAFLFL